MMSIFRLGMVAAVLVAAMPGAAAADPESCAAVFSDVAMGTASASDDAQLKCDIDRAAEISRLSEKVHGPRTSATISIVDTAAPSGAAYVYDVYPISGEMMLEARSVPIAGTASRAPACKLMTVLPLPIVQKLESAANSGRLVDLPAYGSREEVTLNPDGSRTVRLLIESHDIITTISTPDGTRHFSRHAKGSDDIADLNKTIIGVANFSSGWSCNRS